MEDLYPICHELSLSLPPTLSTLSFPGEYSDSYGSSDDEDISPREKMFLVPNSNGFKDFCVKSLKGAAVGRKEIKIAEQGTVYMRTCVHESL